MYVYATTKVGGLISMLAIHCVLVQCVGLYSETYLGVHGGGGNVHGREPAKCKPVTALVLGLVTAINPG